MIPSIFSGPGKVLICNFVPNLPRHQPVASSIKGGRSPAIVYPAENKF